jgi:hypothetical protein
MLLANIDDDSAGRWRKKDEWVRVGNHIAIAPEKIIVNMICLCYFTSVIIFCSCSDIAIVWYFQMAIT